MLRNFKLVAADFSLRPCPVYNAQPVDSSTQAKACGYLKLLPKAA